MVSYAQNCGPQVEIRPPRCTQSRYGLFSAAEVREVEDGNWTHGVRYRSESCTGNVYSWPRPCPPCGAQTCTEPVTITVEVGAYATRRNCQDIVTLHAKVISPTSTWGLPVGTIITVCPSCDIGCTELAIGESDLTELGAVPAKRGTLQRVTFTARESATGDQKTVTVDVGSRAQLTLTVDPSREDRKKVLDGLGPFTGVDPFPLYSSVHCMPGGGFAEEAKRIAEDRMRANEECAVENRLWTDFAHQGADYIGSRSAPPGLIQAIGMLEAALLQRRGNCAGVIHLPAELSFPLSCAAGSGCAIADDGTGTLRTRMGTAISFGACYDKSIRPDGMPQIPGWSTLVATGPVIVQRGPITTYEGLDQWTNDYAAISERTYAVIADCPLVWTVARVDPKTTEAPTVPETPPENAPGA